MVVVVVVVVVGVVVVIAIVVAVVVIMVAQEVETMGDMKKVKRWVERKNLDRVENRKSLDGMEKQNVHLRHRKCNEFKAMRRNDTKNESIWVATRCDDEAPWGNRSSGDCVCVNSTRCAHGNKIV